MKSAAAFMIILLTAVEVADVTSGCRAAGVGVTDTVALSPLGGVIIILLRANAATAASCWVGCACIAMSLSMEFAMVTWWGAIILGTTAVAAPLSEQRMVDGETEGFIIISVERLAAALATAATSALTPVTEGEVAVPISWGKGKAAVNATDGSEFKIISWVMGEL